jgi:hypothetical protein
LAFPRAQEARLRERTQPRARYSVPYSPTFEVDAFSEVPLAITESLGQIA